MNFSLSNDQIAFTNMVRTFADEKMAPYAKDWDEEKFLPVNVLKEAATLGLAGIYIDEKLGGTGLGRLDAALIFEELSTACPSTAAFLSIHNMASWMISKYGNPGLTITISAPSLISKATSLKVSLLLAKSIW